MTVSSERLNRRRVGLRRIRTVTGAMTVAALGGTLGLAGVIATYANANASGDTASSGSTSSDSSGTSASSGFPSVAQSSSGGQATTGGS